MTKAEQITVDVVDGSRRLVHVGSATLPMRVDFDDGQARVRDEDYGGFLGHSRPRDIRKLVARMVRDGKLCDIHVRATVARTQMPTGGFREARVNEFWLTRTQALLVATQSGTPRAWQMTELIVAVFEAVLDRRQPANDIETVSRFEDRLRALETRATLGNGVIGNDRARDCILAPLHHLALLRAGGDARKARGEFMRAKTKLHNVMCYTGAGSSWDNFPDDAQLLSILKRTIDMWSAEAVRAVTATIRAEAEARAQRLADERMRQLRFPEHLPS